MGSRSRARAPPPTRGAGRDVRAQRQQHEPTAPSRSKGGGGFSPRPDRGGGPCYAVPRLRSPPDATRWRQVTRACSSEAPGSRRPTPEPQRVPHRIIRDEERADPYSSPCRNLNSWAYPTTGRHAVIGLSSENVPGPPNRRFPIRPLARRPRPCLSGLLWCERAPEGRPPPRDENRWSPRRPYTPRLAFAVRLKLRLVNLPGPSSVWFCRGVASCSTSANPFSFRRRCSSRPHEALRGA